MTNLNIPTVGPEPGANGVVQESNRDINPTAFKIAAGILLASSLLSLVGSFFGSPPNVIALIIDVWLAISLWRLNASVRNFALFRAYAGAFLWPILLFVQNEVAVALILSVIQLAYCGSLILLLQGETKNWKIYLAVGIFVIFVLCAMSILYLLAFMSTLAQ
jgi:hypothetical protein